MIKKIVTGRGGLVELVDGSKVEVAVRRKSEFMEWVGRGWGSRESGVGSRESGVGSRESGVGSRESGVGSRESGVGSLESGVLVGSYDKFLVINNRKLRVYESFKF